MWLVPMVVMTGGVSKSLAATFQAAAWLLRFLAASSVFQSRLTVVPGNSILWAGLWMGIALAVPLLLAAALWLARRVAGRGGPPPALPVMALPVVLRHLALAPTVARARDLLRQARATRTCACPRWSSCWETGCVPTCGPWPAMAHGPARCSRGLSWLRLRRGPGCRAPGSRRSCRRPSVRGPAWPRSAARETDQAKAELIELVRAAEDSVHDPLAPPLLLCSIELSHAKPGWDMAAYYLPECSVGELIRQRMRGDAPRAAP